MLSGRIRLGQRRLNVHYLFQTHRSSSGPPTNFPELIFHPKFSIAEQEKILSALNQFSNTELLGLNVAQSNIRYLENYKKKKGPFKSLNELLEVDGLNVKTLEKLCKQLITEKPNKNVKAANNENKKIKQLLVPPLPTDTANMPSSAVGIHLAAMGVSWAKIKKFNNELDCWGYEEFGNLPKKMSPVDTFRLAMNIMRQIPPSDAYVLEGTNGMGLQGQKQSSPVTSYSLQLELSSMLLVLINTSCEHNKSYQDDSTKYDALTNCVYFLRAKLPARMFKTLVGNECVSNTATVLQLLGDSTSPSRTLPCTPVTVQQHLKNEYLLQSSTRKELLGQALLLTIAFTDLCIRKNSVSIQAIMPGKK